MIKITSFFESFPKDQYLTHERYLNSLKSEYCENVVVHRIGQKRHQIYTMKCIKTALVPFNDKVRNECLSDNCIKLFL